MLIFSGTGTKVGDPIEAMAIHNVFSEGRTAKNPLQFGSVKSNVGHLENASGVVAVIKAAMMLEKGFILPNTNFKTPNENIPLSEWNMKVCSVVYIESLSLFLSFFQRLMRLMIIGSDIPAAVAIRQTIHQHQ